MPTNTANSVYEMERSRPTTVEERSTSKRKSTPSVDILNAFHFSTGVTQQSITDPNTKRRKADPAAPGMLLEIKPLLSSETTWKYRDFHCSVADCLFSCPNAKNPPNALHSHIFAKAKRGNRAHSNALESWRQLAKAKIPIRARLRKASRRVDEEAVDDIAKRVMRKPRENDGNETEKVKNEAVEEEGEQGEEDPDADGEYELEDSDYLPGWNLVV